MQYYWLIQSTGDDIGKASSQVKGMKDGYDFYGPYSVRNLPLFQKPNFEPNLDALQLNNQAKLTDIIIPTGVTPRTGFFLSEKTKKIFEEFKLSPHIYNPSKVIHKNKTYDNFYWIQFIQEMSSNIDFKKSSFDLKRAFGWQNWIEIESNLKFENKGKLSDFYDSQSAMNRILPNKLSFINEEFDFYGFNYFANSFLLNQKIKNALDTNHIKGIEIIPLV